MVGKNYEGLPITMKDMTNWVAIIGSRQANENELKAAYEFAQKCSRNGKVVVSGLASGVDTAAHQGAIDANGKTIAIVSTPSFLPIYPNENRNLALKIKEIGSILYPFPTKQTGSKQKGINHFQKRLIERDALLAFLCPTIVVVKESSEPVSGGTRWALNYGYLHGKKLFRLDNGGTLHENVNFKKSKIFWEPEMTIKGVFDVF